MNWSLGILSKSTIVDRMKNDLEMIGYDKYMLVASFPSFTIIDTTFAIIVPILLITHLALATSSNHTDVDILQRNCQFDGNFQRFLLMLHTKAANGIYKSCLLGKSTFVGIINYSIYLWFGRTSIWPGEPCNDFSCLVFVAKGSNSFHLFLQTSPYS